MSLKKAIAFGGIAVALIAAALWLLERQVERGVIRDAERNALAWARYEITNLRRYRLQSLAEGAVLTRFDMPILSEVMRYDGLFRFKLYSREGVLRFDSGAPVASGSAPAGHSSHAVAVAATGQPMTIVKDGAGDEGTPDLYSETYLPLMKDGKTVGIVEAYFDQTVTEQTLRGDYTLFGMATIFAMLLSFFGPALACAAVLFRMRAQNAELKEQRTRAMVADKAKTEFLATMSHEIRTPMNGVLGMANLLSQTRLDSRQTMLTDVILQSGQQLLRVINDILDFSKIDAGKLDLHPRPFKLGRLAHDPARIVAHLAEMKRLPLVVRVQPGLPAFVTGDADRLQQVMTNLIGNAVKFTEAGQVFVNVTGRTTGGVGDPCHLRIEIEDTGPGIPADQLENIFDKFVQLDSSSTRTHEGTGLGLAISKGLVELMGGALGVKSVPGQGSTFWVEITLPVAEDEARTSGVPVNAIGRRILSVDDNETNRFIVRELLESWRMEEASATSAREALQLLQSAARQGRHFDALILDQHMPGTNGNGLLEAIRRDPVLGNIGVVMLSSIDAPVALIEGAPSADAYVLKPAPASTLLDALMTALAASSQRARPEAAPSVPEAAPAAAPAGAAETPRTLVLLVEDNHINRLVVKQALADAPIQLLEAHHGAQALELAAEFHPDLIFMDISMPVMNGLEATRRIRERERAHKLPPATIVGVTAHAMPADRYRCIEAGMNDYISKPLDPERLREIVAQVGARHEEAA